MAKESNEVTLLWSSMWSSFRTQPDFVKRWWMKELLPHLKDAMANCTKDVQDEMFAHAPADVRKYFGYVSKDEAKAKVQPKKLYNDEYTSDLMNKIMGIKA